MRFAFEEVDLALRDAAAELLKKECGTDVVRRAWTAPPGELDRRVFDLLGEMGVVSVLVPEADGGLGLDLRSLVLVLEETGRAALPHPIVETAAVAAPVLGGRLGESLVTASFDGAPSCCAADADLILIGGAEGLALHRRDEVAFEALPTVDGARRLALARPLAAGEMITDAPGRDEAFERAALGAAAQLLGLAQAMLDLSVAYVRERQQFGVAIGSFQAIKHHLADALKELAFARPVVYRAADSVARELPTRRRDVSMAKTMASDAAEFVGRQALQCHGAIGYTVEYDLHLYLKRTWALAAAFGDAAWHRRRVGAALGVI